MESLALVVTVILLTAATVGLVAVVLAILARNGRVPAGAATFALVLGAAVTAALATVTWRAAAWVAVPTAVALLIRLLPRR